MTELKINLISQWIVFGLPGGLSILKVFQMKNPREKNASFVRKPNQTTMKKILFSSEVKPATS